MSEHHAAPSGNGQRLVVFVQENKTVDFMFPSLAGWGADVVPNGPLLSVAPPFDQPHDRDAWVHYRMGDYPAQRLSIDDTIVVPYYSWLAKTYTFSDHHTGAGSNSTSGHLLTFTGQTPTFRNPSFTGPHPSWDLPTVFALAERAGVSWGAFVDHGRYPTKLITELGNGPLAAHIHGPGDFLRLATTGQLPQLCYVWSPGGSDEHPPTRPPVDPNYLTNGQHLIWQQVDAVIASGQWATTTFILTWDDWGGYADHVLTPNIETLPDALHPNGFQAISGSRVPLLMFGGTVRQGIDNHWHTHASIPKTAIDLLHLPPLGVPRVDTAPIPRAPRRPITATIHATPPRHHNHPTNTPDTPTNTQPTPTLARTTRPAHATTHHQHHRPPARPHRRDRAPHPTATTQTLNRGSERDCPRGVG